MKVNVVCRDDQINQILNISPQDYEESLKSAFSKIESNEIVSSWKDSFASGALNSSISDFVKIPEFGCYTDNRSTQIQSRSDCLRKIWQIGGKKGWYYANWLWRFRGFLDKLVGGVGLRRGRTNDDKISVGDALDFWRVLYANKKEGRLLLYAEMKLPGEAWLEFTIQDEVLKQTATFRPKGLLGRAYWYLVSPFHEIIFRGMILKIVEAEVKQV